MSVIAAGYEIHLPSIAPVLLKTGIDWTKGGIDVTPEGTYHMGVVFGEASIERSSISDDAVRAWFDEHLAGAVYTLYPVALYVRGGVVVMEYKETPTSPVQVGVVFRTRLGTPDYLSRAEAVRVYNTTNPRDRFVRSPFPKGAAIAVKTYIYTKEDRDGPVAKPDDELDAEAEQEQEQEQEKENGATATV
jgi:hypothetical protein